MVSVIGQINKKIPKELQVEYNFKEISLQVIRSKIKIKY